MFKGKYDESDIGKDSFGLGMNEEKNLIGLEIMMNVQPISVQNIPMIVDVSMTKNGEVQECSKAGEKMIFYPLQNLGTRMSKRY